MLGDISQREKRQVLQVSPCRWEKKEKEMNEIPMYMYTNFPSNIVFCQTLKNPVQQVF